MNRRAEACTPAGVSGPSLLMAPLMVLTLVGASLALLILDAKGAWWLLPPLLAGDALLAYFVWQAPHRLGYRPARSGLMIYTFAGRRQVERGQIKAARLTDYRLGLRIIGSEMPGYCVGGFRSNLGSVRAFTSRRRGRGVLLELKSGERLLINPREPKRCLEPLGIELEEATP
ncbi:PH domain-containing protein [Oceanithermus sp.]